ncbi:isopenicillin N synthase family dioxygenase [Phytoactinopolyspora endophytica]|uniref:isopenicillin N synthase family dioxygenase n=1 Tax=Phytoactinopolyspora endophytica TaxID=1642495 RepID=UPI00101D328A|nr:2-oxoglutarate and iron-dependent oxygenase domain-containing protein [Phytoactinopolyspora endophytica]
MTDTLPTIDVSCFADDAGPSLEQDAVARLIDETCRDTGFFLVTGHGIDPSVKNEMLRAMAAFFAEPEETKEAISIATSPCHRGYVGIAKEALDDELGDLKETLDTGAEQGPDHPEVVAGTPMHGSNQLPSTPGFADAWEAYFSQAVRAAERMQRAIAHALGMPDDHLLTMPGGDVMYHLRFIHYPAQETTVPVDGQLGCGTHTDYGSVTLLAEDGVGGLQVRKRDGSWIDVQAPEGTLVVNIGDLMAIWTNDRWTSNPHRVINPPQTDRYSIPLFVTPPFNAEIAALPTCVPAGEEPRYLPQRSGEYLMSRIDATHSYRNPLLEMS